MNIGVSIYFENIIFAKLAIEMHKNVGVAISFEILV